MNYCENIKCNRISSCDYPCEPYTDYIINLSLKKGNIENKKENEIMDYNIEDILEYDVEDISWLMVLNGKIPFTELIDKTAFLEYLENKNNKYCSDNGLCNVCRNPLKEFESYEDVFGSSQLIEREYICQYGCN